MHAFTITDAAWYAPRGHVIEVSTAGSALALQFESADAARDLSEIVLAVAEAMADR